jgi:hypothetical protein
MELIIPNTLFLNYTYNTSVSAYPNWVSGSNYYKGQRVHDSVAGFDYEAQAYLSNSTTRPSESSNKDWELVGFSGSDALSYDSTASLSEYETWTSGTAVSKGKIQVDLSDRNDYIATVAIASGSNTIKPSVAVLSDDEETAARWVRIGTANAFRMFDGDSLSKTRADSSLTCTARGAGEFDRLCFVGLLNIKTVAVTVNAGEKFLNPSFVSPSLIGWEGTISYSSGEISSANAQYLMSFVVGKTYAVSIEFKNNTGTATLKVMSSDLITTIESNSSTNASGTLALSFTATMRQAYVVFSGSAGSIAVTEVSAKQSGFTEANLSTDLEYSEGNEYKRVCKLIHTAVDSPVYEITLESEYGGEEIQVGLCIGGKANNLGTSLVEATDATDDYSRIVFNEDYGTAELLQRGFSRRVSVTLGDFQSSGAYANHILRKIRATPCFWDLNNYSDSDEGLMLHGLAERPSRTTNGLGWLDTIQIEIKGLVE